MAVLTLLGMGVFGFVFWRWNKARIADSGVNAADGQV
jgi:hypothetical protein